MDASQMAIDAMIYVREISPILGILGGVAFADVMITYLISMFKQLLDKRIYR